MNDNQLSAEANLSLALMHLLLAHRKDPELVGNKVFCKTLEQVNNHRRRHKGQKGVPVKVLLESEQDFDDATLCILENFEALVQETANLHPNMNAIITSKKVKRLSSDAPDQN
ncbi:hypothetical protein [Cerasicoccus fimbriatus]|uniref:hypothetical protein n=1 Tax=Cerasicoccus fimbriatus TaxID=3014554 RepID=UPI0022B38FF0|nr:hypothetical protein [Cerasicoccus sp. TK19100]